MGDDGKIETKDWKIDYHFINARYLRVVLAATFATEILGSKNLESSETGQQVLSIGLGGGTLNSFLRKVFPDVSYFTKFIFFNENRSYLEIISEHGSRQHPTEPPACISQVVRF